jgi:hypothetical protein
MAIFRLLKVKPISWLANGKLNGMYQPLLTQKISRAIKIEGF